MNIIRAVYTATACPDLLKLTQKSYGTENSAAESCGWKIG